MTFGELWTAIPRIGKLAGAVAAVSGAIVGTAQAWPYIEPWLVAHRGYVMQQINDKLEEVNRSVRRSERKAIEGQIETIEVRKSLVDKEFFEIDMYLRRTDLSERERQTIELRKRALTDDLKNLDFRQDKLQREQTGRRP